MAKTIWTSNLNTGIDAIDTQHRMIVDYINQLDDAIASQGAQAQIAQVIDKLVNYTISHFDYEERLLAQADYPFLKAHQNVHRIFIRRLAGYQERFKRGEDISAELQSLMFNWLFGHIKYDDMDFVACAGHIQPAQDIASGNNKGLLGKLFG